MPITYNVGTNIITVTGYTEATPCTFLDIYNADIAGAWGVVSRLCTNLYCFDANLHIGNGSTVTWFADTKKTVKFQATPAVHYINYSVRIYQNAHFRLGTLLNATEKTTDEGCMLMFDVPTYTCIMGEYPTTSPTGDFQAYSLKLESVQDQRSFILGFYNAKIYNFTGDKGELNRVFNSDVYRCSIQNAAYGFVLITGTIDDILLTECSNAMHVSTETPVSPVTKNVVARNNTYLMNPKNHTAYHAYLVNTDSDAWTFNWEASSNKYVYRQYEFDLKVTDKDENPLLGRAVKIWDKDNNLVVDTTTNASGEITTQTLNYGYYTQAGGDTPTMQTPHTIQISGPGDQTYKKKFTLDEKINWRIRLLQTNPVQFLDDNPILQLCPESQEDDRTLFEVV